MDPLRDRVDALTQQLQTLQQQTHALQQHTHTVTRRLRWWRGLACGLVGLTGLAWMLPAVIAQEDASQGGQRGLAPRVAALESLLKHFSREGHDITIKGANLHLVNGLGSTDCDSEQGQPIPDCPNGLGNLIVGYNESREPFGAGEDIRTGSHNVVVGLGQNFSRFGGLVVGRFNEISGDFAAVSGGAGNTASGFAAAVSGGTGNTASGNFAAISGGQENTASGGTAAVSGGQFNTASGGGSAAVSGGLSNVASGDWAAVSGGQGNTASGFAAAVSGGLSNVASGGDPLAGPSGVGGRATVSGGFQNTASGDFSSVSGGQNITQEINFGWAAGSEADEVVVGNFRSP
jgi:hypothetical protein